MKRFEPVQIGDCTLYCGDCLDILPTLGKVDAVVTSPPYDNLREYGGGRFEDETWRWTILGLKKCLNYGGVIVWNVADETVNGSESGTSFKQALHAIDCGLRLHDTMIYIKDNVNFPESVRYFSGHEYMFVFSYGPPKTFNPIKDRRNKWSGTLMHGTDRQRDGTTKKISGVGKVIRDYGMRFNWWKIDNKQPDTGHPAPMPYRMAHDHIVSWTNEQDIVFDPFMGSGTTGVACVNLGRKFIGIEIEPKYFDIACKRIQKAVDEPRLPLAEPKPKQEAMEI